LLILNRNTKAEVDGLLAASLPALTGVAVFTFTYLGDSEQLASCFCVLFAFFTYPVQQQLHYTSGKSKGIFAT
jgi:hypothetical protein